MSSAFIETNRISFLQMLNSLIPREAVEDLNIKIGDTVGAVVKAIGVMIARVCMSIDTTL